MLRWHEPKAVAFIEEHQIAGNGPVAVRMDKMIANSPPCTLAQIRGARTMLGRTQAELAKTADLSTTGLNNIECGSADPKVSTMRSIQTALEAAGIIFQKENEIVAGGPGVRLAKTATP